MDGPSRTKYKKKNLIDGLSIVNSILSQLFLLTLSIARPVLLHRSKHFLNTIALFLIDIHIDKIKST